MPDGFEPTELIGKKWGRLGEYGMDLLYEPPAVKAPYKPTDDDFDYESWLSSRMFQIRRQALGEWEERGGLIPWEEYFQQNFPDVASWYYKRAGRVGEWWGGYQPQARFAPGFQRMMGGLRDSRPYLDWFESMFPSLVREFEATLPTYKGFLSREEAAKQAREQEKGWAAYLRERRPELREEWASLGWRRRGERPYAFAPAIRTVEW